MNKLLILFFTIFALWISSSFRYVEPKLEEFERTTRPNRNTVRVDENLFLRKPPVREYRCRYDDDIASNGARFNSSCGPWRVALSFRGTIRGRCNEHLDRFLYSLPQADVYVHHWVHPETEYIQERYAPTRFLQEDASVIDSAVALFQVSEKALNSYHKSTHTKALIPSFWSISKSLQLVSEQEEHYNFTYDLVISLRWDIGVDHVSPIVFPWLCPNSSKLYSQFGPELNWAFYDMWFYSSSANMKKISRVTDAILNGELYPRKDDGENEFVKLLRTGVPYSDANNYWSNAVLSSNASDRPLMVSSDIERDIWNVHLVWKIFLVRLNLFDAENAMYCTDKAFEEYWLRRRLPEHGYFPWSNWLRRRLPEHGYFPWSNSPNDSSPNCISGDSYLSHDPAVAKRGVHALA